MDRELHRPPQQRQETTTAQAEVPSSPSSSGGLLVVAGAGVIAGAAAAAWLTGLRLGPLLALAAGVLGLMLGRAGWQLRGGSLPSGALSDRSGLLSAGLGAAWVSAVLGQILGATDLFSGIRGTSAENVPLIMVCFFGLPLAVFLASRIAETLRSAERMLDGLWWYGLLTAAALLAGGLVVVEPVVSGVGVFHPSSGGGLSAGARAGLVAVGLLHLVLPLITARLRAGLAGRLRDDLEDGW